MMVRRYDRARARNKSPHIEDEYDNQDRMKIRICEGRYSDTKKHKQRSQFSRYRSIRDTEYTRNSKTGHTATDITIRYRISQSSHETV